MQRTLRQQCLWGNPFREHDIQVYSTHQQCGAVRFRSVNFRERHVPTIHESMYKLRKVFISYSAMWKFY